MYAKSNYVSLQLIKIVIVIIIAFGLECLVQNTLSFQDQRVTN